MKVKEYFICLLYLFLYYTTNYLYVVLYSEDDMGVVAPLVDSVDEFFDKVPKHMRKHVTAELRTEIEKMISPDSEIATQYEEGLLVHTDLMTRYSTTPDRYAKAVKFVAYLNIGKKTYEAFVLTHPEKYAEYKQKAKTEGWDSTKLRNTLSLKGANFKATQIVTALLARTMMPLAVAFSHHRYEAVEKLAYLMQEASSERIQMESADKLLTHLALDKSEFNMEADIAEVHANVVATLANTLDKMVSMQQAEKEINPNRRSSVIMDGIVVNVTKGSDE